jgi:hypothetical protein
MPCATSTPRATSLNKLAMLLFAAATLGLSACATTYSEQVQSAHAHVIQGDTDQALRFINQRLGVRDITELPAELPGHAGLLLLERAAILQAQGNYKLSARDMVHAEQNLEFLDIASGSLDQIGATIYSGDSARYTAPPYERLLLNTLNMVNFLAIYDLEGARVEARRFKVMEQYYIDEQGRALSPGMLAAGNYLAAATYEASFDYNSAVRHYCRAWSFGIQTQDLEARLLALLAMTQYSPRELLDDPSISDLVSRSQRSQPLTYQHYQERFQRGDTLIVVQSGLVPYKQAVDLRVPTALSRSSTSVHSISPQDRQRLHLMHSEGRIQHIKFPELTDRGLPIRAADSVTLRIGSREPPLALGMNVSQQVAEAWDRLAATLIAAAINRTIARAIIGTTGRTAGAIATTSNDPKIAAAGVLGWVAASATQSALSAADTPDTRSWSTLPAFIHISRQQLPTGMQPAEVEVAGFIDRQLISVWPERLNVVNFSRLR